MSRFSLLHPINPTSNTFTFNNNKFIISASSTYDNFYPYKFFNTSDRGVTNYNSPPHWVRLSCDKTFITDEFKFRALWDLAYMSVKDYVIEISKDLTNWTQVYKGVVPETTEYDVNCSFEPIACNAIRLKTLTTYDRRGIPWLQANNFKVYGKFVDNHYIYNNDNNSYGIKKEIPTQ